MSRFDMLGSWMQGAQLGQSQYAQLAAMAQQDAAMRQRQAEEEAQRAYQQQALQQSQGQFDARHALDQERFGQQQTMQNAQLDRWQQDRAWQEQDRAQEEAIRQQEQQYLQHAREWAKQRVRAAIPAGGAQPMRDSFLPAEAMDVGPMQGWGPGPGVPGAAAVPPETDAMLRMIDQADGNSLKQLLPYLDKQDDHRRVGLLVEGIDRNGVGNLLADPFQRAAYQTYKAARDPDNMMRVLASDYETRQRQEAAQEQAIQRQKYALEQITAKAAVRAPAASAGTKTALGALYGRMAKELDKKPEQAYSREKFVLAQAAALMGHSLPDGSVVLNAGQVNPQGFIEVVHPDGSTEGIDPTEFQRRYNTAAEPAPGLLDGPAGPQQQDAQPDEDQVWNRVLEEFQNRNGRGPTQDDADELRQIEQALTGG